MAQFQVRVDLVVEVNKPSDGEETVTRRATSTPPEKVLSSKSDTRREMTVRVGVSVNQTLANSIDEGGNGFVGGNIEIRWQ